MHGRRSWKMRNWSTFGVRQGRRVVFRTWTTRPKSICDAVRERMVKEDRYRPLFDDEEYMRIFPLKWWPQCLRPRPQEDRDGG